ncbi:MAG: hypothetical protein MUE73_00530 [Planctomycetes bacterium]|jgi:hypothetical protein|nr:hypothetical protein [Planctomycetota bacterium]
MRRRTVIGFAGVLLLLVAVALFLPRGPVAEPPPGPGPEGPEREPGILHSGGTASGPVENAGALEAGGPPVGEVVRIVVRDLADGEPVSGVVLLSGTGSGFATSGDGAAEVRAGDLGFLMIGTAGFSVPKQTAEEIRASGVLWCHRTMRVEGRVEEAGGPTRFESPPRIVAVWSPGTPGDASGPLVGEPPWSIFWFREHGVREELPSGRSDPDGRFDIEVPRIRHLYVMAQTEDRKRSGTEPVGVDSRTERSSVRIVLGSVARVTGRILGHDGEPVSEQSLALYSESRMALEDFDLREVRARVHGSAIGAAMDSRRNEVLLTVAAGGRTDADGRFDLSLNDFGEGLLIVWIPGQRPVRVRIGRLAGEREIPEIRLPPPGRFDGVQFRYRGTPLSNCGVVAADLTEDISQLPLPVGRLDANGEIDGALLEPGRKYFFRFFDPDLPKGTIGGWILYDGASVVEVSTDLRRL